jgi:pimeloyl-ACP methyl ester carboxylesterase
MIDLIEQLPEHTQSEYLGHTRYDFKIGDNECVIVKPNSPLPGQRWVWKAMFFEAFPIFNQVMLDRGWWVAFMNVGNTFGCPSAMARFDVFHQQMTGEYGFHSKPILEGMSRGGLYVYNWAVKNLDKVGMVYADNPVCDFKSWPGGKGTGPGSATDWQLLFECYGFKSEQEAMDWPNNPVDSLAPIVKAGIPLVHSYGDADEVVPWKENTGVVAERVKALGGKIQVYAKPGCHHHPHGPAEPDTFADWVLANTLN